MQSVHISKKVVFSSLIIVGILIVPFIKKIKEVKSLSVTSKKVVTVGVKNEKKITAPSPTIVVSIPSRIYSHRVDPIPLPTSTPTPTPANIFISTSANTWEIRSIDAMKDTKDAVCNQRDDVWINQWVGKAVELGANYVAISTPYDNPSCGDSIVYTKHWVAAIRAHGLHVWHRHMPLAFEGIYDVQKNNSNNFLDQIKNYILSYPDLFQAGDIITPIPEPQNGGIQGVNYCANGICQFNSAAQFNQWLRDAMTTVNDAANQIGKGGQLKVGYYGFDGYITWGDNNPDWQGILEDSTVKQMGNITIDHYPESVSDTMANDLQELTGKYPTTPIIIGEWGTVTGGNVVEQIQDDMSAAKKDSNIKGFNYWQFGPSGNGEQLIDNSFSNLLGFATVQSFYK